MLSADEVASVIIARRGGWVDAWSLQKLLYYIQAWHVAVTNEPLFSERIKAWKDGPVVPQVWRARKDQESRLASNQELDKIDLDDLASNLIDLVLATYGSMSGEELRALTHVEEPWKAARGDLGEDETCREEIPLESMARFYRRHRSLGGQSAADLAAGGVHSMVSSERGSVDIDSILASLGDEYSEVGEDLWGGANLHDSREYSSDGIEEKHHRTFAGA